MERRVDADALRRLVEAIFVRAGMEAADAALVADSLVEADLGGVHSHGVLRVPEYVRKLTREGVDPWGRPRVVAGRGAIRVVDGGNSLGAIAAAFAMDRAVELAAEHGIGAVAVRGSNHCGAMAWIARRALDRGMIGLATTNALPTMAPWGGAERIVGINPLAIAIPAGTERPFVYDGAFSGSAHGKIRVSAQRGQPIPPDWATDRLGRPTTDPVAALDGLLLPIGGFKGVGLAMAMGILSSMLSGAAYGTELGDMERGPRAGQDGHFVAAIDVAAFEEPARFRARVDAAIRQVRQARRAPGVDRLYVPGEPEALARKRHLREGVPLTAATLTDLSATAEGLGLVVDL